MEESPDFKYVYLDFDGKLPANIFENKLFLRIANLSKSTPLVQVNDLLFKGSYEDSVGTNLFFEEVEEPPITNIFEQKPPIHLKPTAKQTKILKLKQVKLPRNAPIKQCRETAVLNLNQDYNVVLDKLQQGVLNIEDLAQKRPDSNPEPHFDEIQKSDDFSEPEKEIETLLNPSDALAAKYEKLKRLVRRPVKRIKSPELVDVCDEYSAKFEYHNLERKICQSNDFFRSVTSPMVENSYVGGVDLDRCVLQGLLPQNASFGQILSDDERKKIFSIDNLGNLSLAARYLVIKECVKQIEELIESMPSEELQETDENGRTIADICEVFRKLLGALELTMAQSEGEVSEAKTELPDIREEKFVHKTSSGFIEPVSSDIFNFEDWVDCESEDVNDDKNENEESVESD